MPVFRAVPTARLSAISHPWFQRERRIYKMLMKLLKWNCVKLLIVCVSDPDTEVHRTARLVPEFETLFIKPEPKKKWLRTYLMTNNSNSILWLCVSVWVQKFSPNEKLLRIYYLSGYQLKQTKMLFPPTLTNISIWHWKYSCGLSAYLNTWDSTPAIKLDVYLNAIWNNAFFMFASKVNY